MFRPLRGLASHLVVVTVAVSFISCRDAAPVSREVASSVWVMRLGNRPFIVLTVRGGTGTLSHPAHFGFSGASRFTEIQPTVVTQPLENLKVDSKDFTFTVVSPDDKTDTDDYVLTLADADHATLQWVGLPFKTDWPFTREASGAAVAVATDWDIAKAYSLEPEVTTSNPAMARIYDEDQKPRQGDFTKISAAQWKQIEQQDEIRRGETRTLLDAGELHTAEDFRKAAFIYQHGSTSSDYLLAHTLALVAASKGDAGAVWIAAATLDRYLQSIGKPQIYGTQFLTPAGKPATQDPYDRTLISDALRQDLGVPKMANQRDQLDGMKTAAAETAR